MSNNHISSSEFADLCQSQITLLSQSLGAVWSAVYLTKEISEDGSSAQLFPFVTYPQALERDFQQLPSGKLPEIWQMLQSYSIVQLLPDDLTTEAQNSTAESTWTKSTSSQQLILPLVHQETFIGLLVTGREDREWQQQELKQIEEIVRTIAIARYLEFKYHWTRDELAVQENLRRIEHDRLDNLLHQLRNPLTALRTFGKLLLKRLLPEDPNNKLAQSILVQSDRFQALLEQFEAESSELATLDTSAALDDVPGLSSSSSMDRSSFLLPSSPTALNAVELDRILEPLLTTAVAIAAERELELINSLPSQIPKVRGDFSALREILHNLIDNALKYTPSGGKVKLELRQQDTMLGIAIADTGFGIPEPDRERIFERHYRGIQAQSDIPGTGLGLAIARELVEKMQGKIELISPNNLSPDSPGTTFTVWLNISTVD